MNLSGSLSSNWRTETKSSISIEGITLSSNCFKPITVSELAQTIAIVGLPISIISRNAKSRR